MTAEKPNISSTTIVGTWLKNHGYRNVSILDNNSQAIEIEADSNARRICVHVQVTNEEAAKVLSKKAAVEQVKAYGMAHFREPWIAIIHPMDSTESLSDITWIDLTKH